MSVEPIEWSESRLASILKAQPHGMIPILGSGQHGKTGGAHSLLQEEPFRDRDVVMVNHPEEFVRRHYPGRFRAMPWPEDLKELKDMVTPGRDVLFFDDATFLMAARDSGTKENKAIQKLITVLSHMELYGIVAIQSLALVDVSIVQSQDVFMLHKHMDALAMSFERSQVLPYQVTAELMLRKYRKAFPGVHPKAWTWSSRTNEMLISRLPDYWDPVMSKPFKEVQPWR